MPSIATPTIEDINDTALIVQAYELAASAVVTARTFFQCDATAGAFPVTIPAVSSISGRILIFTKTDASVNAVTITRAGSDTINGATTYVLSNQYDSLTIATGETANLWSILCKHP